MSGKGRLVWILGIVLALTGAGLAAGKTKDKVKEKPKSSSKDAAPKIIPAKDFIDALIKLAKDERVPVASSTLVEKGRGENYYGVDKMLDEDPETFWAEGAKGPGKNEWVAFYIPEGTSHVEITPGAGREQFQNFNRPKHLLFDIYQVKLKRDGDSYKPTFKWLSRTEFDFKDKPQAVRNKLAAKLPEVLSSQRMMYVGVLIVQDIYKGQFDDTAVATFKTTAVWGEL